MAMPLKSSVMPRKEPSAWLPGLAKSAHRLVSVQPVSRICTNRIDAARGAPAPQRICHLGLHPHPAEGARMSSTPVAICIGTNHTASTRGSLRARGVYK